MGDWLYRGPQKSYWVPSFFFPQGFMTAAMQQYARNTDIPIDTLGFNTKSMNLMVENIVDPPETGVYIHGMYMQGAKWDYKRECVEDSDPKIPIVEFPVIHMEPYKIEDIKKERKFDCPLYKTSLRAGELSTTGHSTNFCLYITLPTEVHQDYWIRRGTALLMMEDS